MRSNRHSSTFASGLASLFLVTISLLACNQTRTSLLTAVPESKTAALATKEVHIIFEGPWAFVDDPKDPNSVLALAPKTTLHRDLYISANDESALTAGTYELSFPSHRPATSAALDPSFAQVKIGARNLQRALEAKSERYVIRLPKPEAYLAAKRFRARLGSTYPPDATTERNYAAYVSFRYTVASLQGFSISGIPDKGTFNPMQLQLETPIIRFVVEPNQVGPEDACHSHSRDSFRVTTKFLGLTLYVDFPNDSADCHKTDPQVPHSANAKTREAIYEEAALPVYEQIVSNSQTADAFGSTLQTAIRWVVERSTQSAIVKPMAVMVLWHGGSGICISPMLFLTTTP